MNDIYQYLILQNTIWEIPVYLFSVFFRVSVLSCACLHALDQRFLSCTEHPNLLEGCRNYIVEPQNRSF